MASIAMIVGGAMVNALAFSGSNYLFSMLGHKGVDEERERHDKAVEQLQAAQAEWGKRRTERIDWISEEIRRQGHAVQSFQDVDAAMQEYALVTGKQLDPMGPEPQLGDFYAPSDNQKGREYIFIGVGLFVVGVMAYKISQFPWRPERIQKRV